MPRHPLGEKAMTDAERQRKRRGRLRKERGTDDRLSDRQKLAEAQKEIWRLRQRISDLEAARALRERAALAAKTEAAKSTPPTEPDAEDPRIARLKKANSELRGKLRHMHKFYEEESSKRGIMTFATYGKLMKCLHPDNKPSDAERREACALLSQWKQDGDRARRQAR